MELEGNLSASMAVADVLQFLGLGNMSGRLNFSFGLERGLYLLIVNGKICGISSLDSSNVIGKILLTYGYLSRVEFIDANDQYTRIPVQNRPRTLLTFMVLRQIIGKQQADKILQRAFEDEVLELFNHKEGSFYFEKIPPEVIEIPYQLRKLEVDQVIMEGSRRSDEWERCIADIPSMDLIPCVKSYDRRLLTGETRLPQNVWKVYSLINNRRQIQTLCEMIGLGTFVTVRCLHELLTEKMITFETPAIALEQANLAHADLIKVCEERAKTLALDADTPIAIVTDMTNEFILKLDSMFELAAKWTKISALYPHTEMLFFTSNGLNSVCYSLTLRKVKEDIHFLNKCTSEILYALTQLVQDVYRSKALEKGAETISQILTQLAGKFRERANALQTQYPDFSFDDILERMTPPEVREMMTTGNGN